MCAISLMVWTYLSWREVRQIHYLFAAEELGFALHDPALYRRLIVPAFAVDSLALLFGSLTGGAALAVFVATAGADPADPVVQPCHDG